VLDSHGRERERYKVPYGAAISVKDGAAVKAGQTVANWDPHTHPIVSEVAGVIRFTDFIDGVTVQAQTDELTGLESAVGDRSQASRYAGQGSASDGSPGGQEGQGTQAAGTDIPAQYFLPRVPSCRCRTPRSRRGRRCGAYPAGNLQDRDITGGLPRVADLFEARKPRNLRFWRSARASSLSVRTPRASSA
jgi:DNA-directed RNA polymerase subunit beta'